MNTTKIREDLNIKIEKLDEEALQQLHEFVSALIDEKQQKKKKRQLGTLPGLVKYMSPDFDEPLADFKEYMPE